MIQHLMILLKRNHRIFFGSTPVNEKPPILGGMKLNSLIAREYNTERIYLELVDLLNERDLQA